ncbi:MAG: OmpH family outer membrane protein [Alphaproteobacteria bacterium]|nr:OmpH family outer membrane protein [Alphaproteobacteria bacterium]
MKKLLLAAALVAFAGSAMAQDLKVGVVDLAKVQENSTVFRDFAKRRDAMLAELRAEGEKADRELAAAQQKLMSERASVSEEEFNRRATQFTESVRTAQERLVERTRAMEERAKKDFTELTEGRLQPVINTIARSQNLNLVLTSAAVLHSDSSMDITDQVIKQLDAGAPRPPRTRR